MRSLPSMNTRFLLTRTTILCHWFSNILISGPLYTFKHWRSLSQKIKVKKFLKVSFSLIITNPLHINNIAYEKIAIFSKTKSNLTGKVSLLYIFVNLLNVWFNGISTGFSSASPFDLLGGKWKSFRLRGPTERVSGTLTEPRPHFEIPCHREQDWIVQFHKKMTWWPNGDCYYLYWWTAGRDLNAFLLCQYLLFSKDIARPKGLEGYLVNMESASWMSFIRY